MSAPRSQVLGEGLGVALATPLTPDLAIDARALEHLVQHVVLGGTDFVVALGSTGEAAMLDEAERDAVVATVREHCGGAALVVGTGASSTGQAIVWTRRAHANGAAAALVVMPPYTKPTQAGIEAHFRAISDAVPELPLIAYNVPSRTGVNLQPATLALLWQQANVIAIKESSGDLMQIARIAAELPAAKTLLAGDDALLLPTVAVGGRGVVSVAGNVAPRAMRELLDAARAGDVGRAQARQAALLPLFDALNAEPNPIPIKAALALAGLCGPELRLPLLPAGEPTRARLQRALRHIEEAAHA
jgi:4-hydroxy-tetrahydrodipicolinate synthase